MYLFGTFSKDMKMNEKFLIEKGAMHDENFKEFAKKYEDNVDYLTDVLMLMERDEMFIKMNMKKLLYYIYKNNKEKKLE